MIIRDLGTVDYSVTQTKMRAFTAARTGDTSDELWLCQHPAVFTQGLAGKPEHVLLQSTIPIVQSDRGGQVTYHGAGQVVAYPLIDLHRQGIFVKEYVYRLESALIRTLAAFQNAQGDVIVGHRVTGAPGIYVRLGSPFSHAVLAQKQAIASENATPDMTGLGKIAALGVKVSRGRTYHGVSLNVDMDLSPFYAINPCGYAGLQTVDMATMGVKADVGIVAQQLAQRIAAQFNEDGLNQ